MSVDEMVNDEVTSYNLEKLFLCNNSISIARNKNLQNKFKMIITKNIGHRSIDRSAVSVRFTLVESLRRSTRESFIKDVGRLVERSKRARLSGPVFGRSSRGARPPCFFEAPRLCWPLRRSNDDALASSSFWARRASIGHLGAPPGSERTNLPVCLAPPLLL